MARTIEVVYEDDVLKPLMPIKGLREHERVMIILCSRPVKKGLRELAGILTHEEAEAMQNLIQN